MAVIFDMDGLLLDTERICLECFVEARLMFGLSEGPEYFLRCVGLRGKKARKIVSESLDEHVSLEEFSAAWDTRLKERLAGNIPVKYGVEALIKVLSAKGIPMGVATSTDTHSAQDQLGRAGLLQYFECVIGGDNVQNHKPDPEVYLRVASHFDREIRTCFAFEDSDAGTLAAVTSGAKTIQVPDLTQPSDETRKLGHLVAPNIVSGAVTAGVIERSELPGQWDFV